MFGYSPFEKGIAELTTADLSVLRDVPEGWYIEYKQELPNGRSIAKSLSAFANTYGGWLFYGIAESGDGRRVAGKFSGIPTKDVPAAEQAIRQAASSLISPAPYFETKVLNGPEETLGIGPDCAIIVIGIPQGNNAPYVHGSGVIYRRVADASEPRPETDRHFLDLLWQRGKDTVEYFDEFARRKPRLSEAEENISTIRICFFPDPWNEKPINSKLEFDEFALIMGSQDPADGGIPFDNVYPTGSGYIARQARNNDASGLIFSWRYYMDCTSEVVLPLNYIWVSDLNDAANFLEGYEFRNEFLRRCQEQKMKGFYLVDLSQTYSVILSIIKRKKALFEKEGLEWNLFYKVQLRNFWRRVPYVDLKEVASFIETHGIPVVQDNTSYFPLGRGPASCKEIKPYQQHEVTSEGALQIDATVMFLNICRALGLPFKAFGMAETEDVEGERSLTRLLRLGLRAQEVTTKRGRKRDDN